MADTGADAAADADAGADAGAGLMSVLVLPANASAGADAGAEASLMLMPVAVPVLMLMLMGVQVPVLVGAGADAGANAGALASANAGAGAGASADPHAGAGAVVSAHADADASAGAGQPGAHAPLFGKHSSGTGLHSPPLPSARGLKHLAFSLSCVGGPTVCPAVRMSHIPQTTEKLCTVSGGFTANVNPFGQRHYCDLMVRLHDSQKMTGRTEYTDSSRMGRSGPPLPGPANPGRCSRGKVPSG